MNALPLVFDRDGLLPVVVQDDQSNAVLMIAFMNKEAIEKTRESGKVHYWSRSRQKLWRKGETSGHDQVVKSIHVNCYENSLLIRVDQVGACCHMGYQSCYYREIGPDGQFIETMERVFVPEEVYGARTQSTLPIWIGAYKWLADNDLSEASGTSKLLHTATPAYLAARISDELREMTGVLTGEHRHEGLDHDLKLEGSQVLYWIALTAIRSELVLSEIVSAIASGQANPTGGSQVNLHNETSHLATRWNNLENWNLPGLISETVSTLARAAEMANTTTAAMIDADLGDLQSRSYLDRYFGPGPR